MAACGVAFEALTPGEVRARWPRIVLPAGGTALFQADTGIAHAARTVATLQRLARERGADLRPRTPARLVDAGGSGVVVATPSGSVVADHVVVTADGWTNDVLAPLDIHLNLTVTQEQVSYFAPDDPVAFAPDRFPVWIWMDDPSFYGFPTFGEPTVKAGQDVGGAVTTADGRDFAPDPDNLARLTTFLRDVFPGSAERVERTVTCLYTLPPDRDFVLGALPAQPSVVVGLGAGHGFKFAPTAGRVLADLVLDGRTTSDIAPFGADRPALTGADQPVSWLV
jgi:sarcosine oxidase